MHVIDDATMQEIFRFVKQHQLFARRNRMVRELLKDMKKAIEDLANIADGVSPRCCCPHHHHEPLKRDEGGRTNDRYQSTLNAARDSARSPNP